MTTIYDPDKYYDAGHQGVYSKKILIEGDSWVSHPQMQNLAMQFDKINTHKHLILNLANPGDNAGSPYGSSDAVFRA